MTFLGLVFVEGRLEGLLKLLFSVGTRAEISCFFFFFLIFQAAVHCLPLGKNMFDVYFVKSSKACYICPPKSVL